MDLKPWRDGDRKGQEDAGYNEGYSDGVNGRGCHDGIEIDTPYNRGYWRGYEQGQRDKTVVVDRK